MHYLRERKVRREQQGFFVSLGLRVEDYAARNGAERSCAIRPSQAFAVTRNDFSMCSEATAGMKMAASRLNTIFSSSGRSEGTSTQSSRIRRPLLSTRMG